MLIPSWVQLSKQQYEQLIWAKSMSLWAKQNMRNWAEQKNMNS